MTVSIMAESIAENAKIAQHSGECVETVAEETISPLVISIVSKSVETSRQLNAMKVQQTTNH